MGSFQYASFVLHRFSIHLKKVFGSTFMNGIQVNGYIMYCVAEGKVVPRLC